MGTFLLILLTLVGLFLIMLILVQRGRGGGLSGALGGAGGTSAFGSKAGDVFTKITMWTAFLWIVLCAVSVKYMGTTASAGPDFKNPNPKKSAPVDPGVGSSPTTDETPEK